MQAMYDQRRGEHCKTPGYRQPRPRTGSRIELARSLYGPHANGTTATPRHPELDIGSIPEIPLISDHRSDLDLSVWDNDPEDAAWSLSEMSAESSLSRRESHGWLSSHLVEEYFVAAPYPKPFSRWRDFRLQFEQAGRRPDQLPSPMSEVLAYILVAFGALVTNAPCVLGSDVPPPKTRNETCRELAGWGQRRARICEELKERAVRKADEKGAFRCESVDGISVMLMLSMLLGYNDDPSQRKGRPYRMAAVSHARTIVEDHDSQQDWSDIVTGPLPYMLYLHDTLTATSAGTLPILQDEDIRAICPVVQDEASLPSVEEVSRAVNGEGLIWVPVKKMWSFAVTLMRRLIPYLRQRPDDSELSVIAEDGLQGSCTVLGEAYKQLKESRQCAASVKSILSQFLALRRPGYGLVRYYFVTIPNAHILTSFSIHRAITRWIETFPAAERTSSDFRWVALSKLASESYTQIIEDARNVAHMLHEFSALLPSPTCIALGPSMSVLYALLPTVAAYLCTIPTFEDGCVTSYTLPQKREELTWLLEGLYSFGWTYADASLHGTTSLVEQKLSELNSAQLAY